MNKDRRKRIKEINDKLMDIQIDLEAINNEEEEAYDNLPSSFQDGEKGEKMQEGIGYLEDAISSISDVMSNLDDAIQ